MIKENKKQIVFYCASHPFEMIYKIAREFKKRNYETVLLTMSEKDRFDHEFYSKAFDRIICSNFQFFKPSFKTSLYFLKRGVNLIKFLISMKLVKPHVVIGISGNNWQLKLAHKYLFKKYPFIYFPYDIISHFYNSAEEALKKSTKKFEINAEKYCFENADGIIHKGDPNELNYINGRIHKNLKITKRQLNFLPYCSKEFMFSMNRDKLSKKDKFFHMVSVGGFPPPEFKDILNQGIHIHLYFTFKHLPEKQEEEYITNLFKGIEKNKFFHIHKPLSPKELIPEISKYDFGFWTAKPSNKVNIEPTFATGNKLASYLEAGIPFVYNKELIFIDKLMKRYGLSISFDEGNLKNLKKRLQQIDWKKIEKNVITARKELNMEKNFVRLENFIKEIVSNFKKR